MHPAFPQAPVRRGQPFAAAMALAVHAGVVAALLGRTSPRISQPAGPELAIPLPPLAEAPSDGGGGSRVDGPALAPVPPAPAPWRPGGGVPRIAPLPAPAMAGATTGADPGWYPGTSLPAISWDSIAGGDAQVVPPRLLDSLVVDYPDKRVEGLVEVEYVIETTGRMNPASFHVLESPGPRLALAVRSALLGARFRPGLVHDRPARMLVHQRFRFQRR